MKLSALALVVIALIFPTFVQPSFAQTSDCSVPLGEIIISQNFGLAYFCSGKRLEADPQDQEAILVFARSALEIGQYDVATDFAQRSRELELSKPERFVSFLISGLANARQENYLTAKIYLRRAANFTQNDRQTQIIGSAMSQVRANSPWSFRLSLNIDPSSNVNGGSIEDTFVGYAGITSGELIDVPITEDGQAQPGIGYSISAGATHKIRLSNNALWENSVMYDRTRYDGLGRNNYRLAAKSGIRFRTSGDARARWFASVMYEQVNIAEGLEGELASDFYNYYDQTTFGLERRWSTNSGNAMSIYGNYIVREGIRDETRGATIARVGMSYGFPLSDSVVMRIGGYVEDAYSEHYDNARTAQNISMQVSWDIRQIPVNLAGRISYTNVDYKLLASRFPEIRENDDISLNIGVTPKNIQFYGFRPTFGLQLNRNFSNINVYDTFKYSIYTRISSVF